MINPITNGDLWEAEARERDLQALRDFAAELKARRSKRSRDQAVALIAGLGELEQIEPRKWVGGPRGDDIGTDPSRWPKRIDTTGFSAT